MKNRIADGDSSSTAYLASNGPFYMSSREGGNWRSGEAGPRLSQQRYLPGMQEQSKNRPSGGKNHRKNYADPSEPIYTDPSLFERWSSQPSNPLSWIKYFRSRSIRSLAFQDQIQESAKLWTWHQHLLDRTWTILGDISVIYLDSNDTTDSQHFFHLMFKFQSNTFPPYFSCLKGSYCHNTFAVQN